MEITQQNIDDIFKLYRKYQFKFKNSYENIINESEEHQALIKRYNIPQYVLNNYNKDIIKLSTKFELFKNANRFNPYYIFICGCFQNTYVLYHLFFIILNSKTKTKIDDNYLKNIYQLEPYFKKYSDGFKRGYNYFVDDEIKKNLLFETEDEIIKEIVKYVIVDRNSSHFKFKIEDEDNNIIDLDWSFKVGLEQGYLYKAWSIVFSKFELFESELSKRLLPKISKKLNKNLDTDYTILNLIISQLNIINKLIINDIKDNAYRFNYLVIEREASFLDINILKTKFPKKPRKNEIIELIELCNSIIIHYEKNLKGLEILKLDFDIKNYFHYTELNNRLLNFDRRFYTLEIFEKTINVSKIEKYALRKLQMYHFHFFNLNTIHNLCKKILLIINENNSSEIKLSNENLKFLDDSNKELNRNIDIHPKHNANYWDIKCYELFKYLYDNYYDGKTKRKITNIWFFLNENKDSKYLFDITKEKYIDFIKINYNVEITNFNKAEFKYENEVIKLKNHRINFESLNK